MAAAEGRKDFFVSYTGADRRWAEWIAWVLEEAGHTVVLQAWDFRPGSNFVLAMQQAAEQAERTIAVLSPDFLASRFTAPEWAAAFARDSHRCPRAPAAGAGARVRAQGAAAADRLHRPPRHRGQETPRGIGCSRA